MRFAIVGAGAVGAYAGAHLAVAGEEVAMVAHGSHLRAMQERGVRIRSRDSEIVAHPFVTENPNDIGPVDAVFLSLKAHSLVEMAPRLAPLFGPETPVIAAQNGIPWWYFENHGGPMEGTHLDSVDPGGVLSAAIPIGRVIGCVIYLSTVIEEPGVILHIEGNRLAIGEPGGVRSERCERISRTFEKTPLKCHVRKRIRHDVWVKLIGNLAFNPISALTRATLYEMTHDLNTRALVRAIMEEGQAVARALGVELDISIDKRLEGASKVGPHKTSMLQDIEMGKPLELEGIVGSVIELADKLGVPVPHTRTVYVCTKLLERAIRPSQLA